MKPLAGSARIAAPATVLVMHRVKPDCEADYVQLQEEITAAMRQQPGFLGKELIRPVGGLQDEWVSVFRFQSAAALRRWLGSDDRRRTIARLADCLLEEGRLQVVAGNEEGEAAVTAVFSHTVRPGHEEAYLAWRRDILHAMAETPGYLGVETSDARPGLQDEWIIIARYRSAADLEQWMASPVRAGLVSRLEEIVERYEARPLASGLGGWFAFADARTASAVEPPRWKQVLAVTLGLYPTVMAVALLVEPWFDRLPMAVRMVGSNFLCVGLLTWLVMPWLTERLRPWLEPPPRASRRHDLRGALLVLAVLAAWVFFFLLIL